jgi:hypothetical protein
METRHGRIMVPIDMARGAESGSVASERGTPLLGGCRSGRRGSPLQR